MNTLTSTSLCNYQVSRFPSNISNQRNISPFNTSFPTKICFKVYANANANELEAEQKQELEAQPKEATKPSTISATAPLDKDLKKVVQKTAATFAPRASTASKNPAVPGSVLYTVFEVQAYACMLLGGVLSYNLIFPSNEPDLWRLMGMWSIWMFTIPSLRARDCSKNEKEALNYLFLLVPLLNVTIPFFVKSFAVVWSADTVAFFAMYAWKLGWLQRED
ncbi:hypothetical protein RchiOBHm_Chr6g0291981 [Rosa chinensis]|uniref:Resistance to phytophthora 1 n=1 Tax=Rosa chinensis TaxID=74649 RepID=A0A2P6PW89_ROSCH|nr:protein RESISTANCE TO PHYTOPHTHORA 1, chloroplastic [Rosa chinensis]PRQ26200.1 hypothetical protein RchiOBHm_Chr6g0291981 [Rosa chinensis]